MKSKNKDDSFLNTTGNLSLSKLGRNDQNASMQSIKTIKTPIKKDLSNIKILDSNLWL